MIHNRHFFTAISALTLIGPVFAGSVDTFHQEHVAIHQAVVQGKIPVNEAKLKVLAKVKGLSASRARSILAWRKKNGNFKNLDELVQVKALKKLKPEELKKIQDQLVI